MSKEQHQRGPDVQVVAAAVLTVAATYGYFLIFAQFGFLKSVAAAGAALKPVMTVMGLAGIGGSVLAAGVFTVAKGRRLLAAGFATCALAAICAVTVRPAVSLSGVALLVGLGTGFTTVTLANILRRVVGAAWLGRTIGLGTGLAYGFCNLPPVFQADAGTQAWLGALAAIAGAAGAARFTLEANVSPPAGGDYARGNVLAWVLILLALVGLDSAAFYHIQHTPDILEHTWTGAGRLYANAAVHVVAAVLAGAALDWRRIGSTTGLGAGLLLAACGFLAGGGQTHPITVALYTAGVSVYSVVLVYYPAHGLRPWLAALIYAVAGWIGSAVGIGLAENWPALPPGVVVMAAVVILGGLLGRQILVRRGPARRG